MALKRSRWWMMGIAAGFSLLLLAASHAPTGPIASELVFKAMRCPQQPCFIEMKSLATGFAWDTMYVFDPILDREQVRGVIGTSPPKFTDGYLKIAFVDRGKVVHFEEENYELEKSSHNRIAFVLPKEKRFGTFTPNTSFNVSAGELGEGKYIVLWDVCHLEQNGQAHQGPCPLLE
jgi:hypothetical protein